MSDQPHGWLQASALLCLHPTRDQPLIILGRGGGGFMIQNEKKRPEAHRKNNKNKNKNKKMIQSTGQKILGRPSEKFKVI